MNRKVWVDLACISQEYVCNISHIFTFYANLYRVLIFDFVVCQLRVNSIRVGFRSFLISFSSLWGAFQWEQICNTARFGYLFPMFQWCIYIINPNQLNYLICRTIGEKCKQLQMGFYCKKRQIFRPYFCFQECYMFSVLLFKLFAPPLTLEGVVLVHF